MKYMIPKETFLCLLFSVAALSGQQAANPGATEVLEKSIAYHDPNGQWGQLDGTFTVRSSRPGKSDRISLIRWDQPRSFFRIEMTPEETEIALEMTRDACSLEYGGSPEFSSEIAEKYRLNCERARMWRDYYTYLYGLPMKLRDPGTHISPTVERRPFMGKEYLVLKVTYDEAVGEDTWYFYFDTETYAMEVYQFFHDESQNDGEYILLEGEADLSGIRVPASRTWYTNSEDRLLGTDHLEQSDQD